MTVVALSADLMDRSKISAAYPDATLVRSATQLAEHDSEAALMLVDLNRLDADQITALGSLAARVVAYGSHVDETLLEQATTAGAEALPRSVFFRRISHGSL